MSRLETDLTAHSSFITSSLWSHEQLTYTLWTLVFSSWNLRNVSQRVSRGTSSTIILYLCPLFNLERPQVLLRMADSSPSPKTQPGHQQNTSVNCTSQHTLCLVCSRAGKLPQRHSQQPLTHQGSYRMSGLKINYPSQHPLPPPPPKEKSQLPS